MCVLGGKQLIPKTGGKQFGPGFSFLGSEIGLKDEHLD